jgi:hypothetical protein
VWNDVKYALRGIRRNPSFTMGVVATLAIGIGATAAVFSLVDAIVLRPLPVRDANRLVRYEMRNAGGESQLAFAEGYAAWRDQTSLFDAVSAHRLEFMNLTGRATAELAPVARVTASFFRIFPAAPAHGRVFTGDEDRPGGPEVAVLDAGFWARQFGSDPRVIGNTVELNGILSVLATARHEPYRALKDAEPSRGAGANRNRFRAGVIVCEVAAALMLVVGAALLIRTSMALGSVEPGFRADHLLTMRMSVTGTRFETPDGMKDLTAKVLDEIGAVPGVTAVGAGCCMPLETVWQLPFVIEGRPRQSLTRAGNLVFSGFGGWTFASPGGSLARPDRPCTCPSHSCRTRFSCARHGCFHSHGSCVPRSLRIRWTNPYRLPCNARAAAFRSHASDPWRMSSPTPRRARGSTPC